MLRKARLKAGKPLERRTPLADVSPKRAAQMSASVKAKRPKATGPDAHTVDVVLERDHWACVCCGRPIKGVRSRDWSVGHRRPRRMGGDTRPDTNLPSNLITLHGSGTTGCHGDLESRRADAIVNGWLLHEGDVPSQTAICHAVHGWTYLTDDGRAEQAPPPVLVGEVIR